MVSGREAGAIAKKQLALREHLWPGLDKRWVWDFHTDKGFTRMPKTLPLLAKIMDEMTKGAPVSSTYITLWCCTWDNNAFVALNKPGEMANAAGFGGQRGIHTWASRMKKLHELRFIDIKAGKSGPMSSAIIFNPHRVIRMHHNLKTPGLTEASYTSLIEWALDIGVVDMTDPMEAAQATPAPPPSTPLPPVPTPRAPLQPVPLPPAPETTGGE
jgi:hypothetical protein